MVLGGEIKTMDFSMPSSYNDLSEPTASAANVEGLAKEYKVEAGNTNLFAKEKKEKKPKKAKKKEERKKDDDDDDDKGPKYEVVDMGLPSYSDSTVKKDRGAFSL